MFAASTLAPERGIDEEPEAVAFWLSELGTALDSGSSLQRDALARASSMARIAARIIRLQAERIALLERAADTDPLTGLVNRRGFMRRLSERTAEARLQETPGIVLFADIDGLRHVNERFGQDAGDRLLQAFAQAVRRSMRITDVCGRLGGDEFAVVLDRCPAEQGLARAARLGSEIAALEIEADGATFGVSASIGIAPFDGDEGAETLIALADAQMIEAKRART